MALGVLCGVSAPMVPSLAPRGAGAKVKGSRNFFLDHLGP